MARRYHRALFGTIATLILRSATPPCAVRYLPAVANRETRDAAALEARDRARSLWLAGLPGALAPGSPSSHRLRARYRASSALASRVSRFATAGKVPHREGRGGAP